MDLKSIPEIGKKYNCYDDGKIKPSRHCIAEIKNIIPFIQAKGLVSKDIYEDILASQGRYDWLFAPETDYIIEAEMSGTCCDDNDPIYYFIRTKDGGWFSLGDYWSARLDIDNSITENLIKEIEEYKDCYDEKELKKILEMFV